jgi:hypothetical protein
MNKYEVTPSDVKPHPSNPNWTMPKSWGVWQLPEGASGRRYRMGNNPIRETELINEFGSIQLIALYTSRDAAKNHRDDLNE